MRGADSRTPPTQPWGERCAAKRARGTAFHFALSQSARQATLYPLLHVVLSAAVIVILHPLLTIQCAYHLTASAPQQIIQGLPALHGE